jgi:hypothetical protein
MELLNVIRARVIWLIYIQDINPHGKNINAYIIDWLRNKYKFLKCPSSIYERNEGGALVFSDGSFKSKDGSDISVDLAIYNDGFIADTRSSTKDTELFLEDVLHSLIKDFDLVYSPEMLRKKLYVSELTLRAERHLNNINPRMQAFIRKITSMIDIDNPDLMELSSLSFWWDPASPNGQSHFQFERTVNTPFFEQRYYSRAPLNTEDHLSFLNEFEDLLLG